MSFRFSKLAALLMAFGLVACTPDVGEQPPDSKGLELAATKCLNQSADDLKRFFDGTVNEGRLAEAWKCVETAFLQFEKYVVGKDQDRYTSQEIVTFLESNFFEDAEKNKITPELQKELMKLKQIFIGGDTNFVTRDELRRSQAFIQQISRMTLKLNPHMKIIVVEWKPQLDTVRSEDLATFEKANKALQEFATELAVLIGKNVSLYQINDIVSLFREFEKFFKSEWEWVQDIEKLVPGFKKLKIALASGDENSINEKEWGPVLTLGARGYFQFLRYQYFIKSTPETGGAIRLVYVARTLEDVFSIFQDLVSQKASGVVTAREVYEILNGFQQFWEDLKVSENLVNEFMKLKQVLIGGSAETWTAVDFEEARLKVPELRRIIENFMPYFSIYSSEWDPEMEDPDSARETFKQSKIRLAVVAQDFGRFLRGSYSYDDFILLIKEITTLYPSFSSDGMVGKIKTQKVRSGKKPVVEKPRDISKEISEFRDVFLELKKMIYNEPDTVIQKSQWAQVLPLMAQVFSMYQYQDYFLVDKSWKKTQAIQDLDTLVDDVVGFARNLFQVSHKGYFNQAELVSLTNKLSDSGAFGNKFKPETVESIWTAVLQHFLFDPERRMKGEKNDRLGLEQIAILSNEFSIWVKAQVALNAIFDNDALLSLTPKEVLQKLKDKVQQSESDQQLRLGLQGVYSIIDGPLTYTWDSEDQLEISNRVNWQYRMNALFQANLTRAITRLLLRSFAEEPTLNRVNECQTQEAFDLLVGIFRDLKIFDPAKTFISSRFLEANIFMSRGNGDKFLDFNEISELINVIFSGLRMNSKLESSLRNICEVSKKPDGKEFVSFKCMSEHHYVRVREYMTQIPDFKAYVESLAAKDKGESSIMRDEDDLTLEMADGEVAQDEDSQDTPPPVDQGPRAGPRSGFATWNIVFKQTLKATGWAPNKGYGDSKEESVLFDEAVYYPFIIQYTELLYSRFDYTKNGYLQSFEAKKAFPTFKPTLRELADEQIRKGFIKEKDLLSVFTFLLRYKEEPGFSTLFKWLSWKGNESKWEKEVWVGRTDIAQILGLIGDKSRESSEDAGPTCKKAN